MPAHPRHAVGPRFGAPLGVALALFCLASSSLGKAADAPASLTVGIAGQVVAGAWNPVRVETRDLPASTLQLVLDVGTLRQGEVPVVVTHQLKGGGGVSWFESDLYVPPFRSLSWRVTTSDRVVASGSLSSREADERPLDLLLAPRGSALYSEVARSLPGGARLVEVVASDLPSTPAAYDGVRSLVVDASTAPVEAVVAAAVAGARVVLTGGAGALPARLAGLVPQSGAARLGAGSISMAGGVSGAAASEAFSAAAPSAGWATPRAGQLLSAVLEEPLVAAPAPAPVSALLVATVAYSVLALLLLKLGGGPGLITALVVAGLGSVGAWRVLRPPPPPYEGEVAVGVVGGALAVIHEARESLTLPPTVLDFGPGAAPDGPRAYTEDAGGVHVPTAAWRSVAVRFPPRAVSAPLALRGGSLLNLSGLALTDVYVTGLGAQREAPPGATLELGQGELGAYPPRYVSLVDSLPPGTLLAQSGCRGQGSCVVWIADASGAIGAER